MAKLKIVEFLINGKPVFREWFDRLEAHAAAKVTTALYRLEEGNSSNIKPVGKGVAEYKIDFGGGYRIYFGQDGMELIVLLAGGTKRTQGKDILLAQKYWQLYKAIKKRNKEE